MDTTDRQLFAASLRQAAERASGGTLDHALHEMGWADALDDDPQAAISQLFAIQGETGATSSALDQVVRHALGPTSDPEAPVVLPPVDRWDPPGTLAGDRLEVGGVVALSGAAPDALVVVVEADGVTAAWAVAGADLDLRPVRGLDPDLGLVSVHGDTVAGGTRLALADDRWPAAVARARLALAHQLVGAATTMLGRARTHALERVQFGVTISSFQAVRHRLAEALVAIETAQAVIDAAWRDGSPASAAMAKAAAGREARTVARHAQQVLAGIGFTTEHDLHRYVRRVVVLDGLLGTSRSVTTALGHELLASRQLPPPLPL